MKLQCYRKIGRVKIENLKQPWLFSRPSFFFFMGCPCTSMHLLAGSGDRRIFSWGSVELDTLFYCENTHLATRLSACRWCVTTSFNKEFATAEL